MPKISSYVDYLPPILWSESTHRPELEEVSENGSSGFGGQNSAPFLARMLRIFEKILTGVEINAEVVCANAPFTQAINNRIELTIPDDSNLFRPRDAISIEGASERAEIESIEGNVLLLTTSLSTSFGSGIVRIADLMPNQTIFRHRSQMPFGKGEVLILGQGSISEQITVDYVNGEYMALRTGLVNQYSLGADSVPIVILDGLPTVSVKERIDNLARLFNPWYIDSEYLPWFASWVALSLSNEWSDYQKRKLIANMHTTYQKRGLKEGLLTYLDIFAVTKANPRIVLDDGEALFKATPQTNGEVKLHALAYSTNYEGTTGPESIMLHPSAIAVDSANRYIIADLGDDVPDLHEPSLWRLTETGEVEFETVGSGDTSRRIPRPLYKRTQGQEPTIDKPIAIAVHNDDRYAVLDVGASVTGLGTVNAAIFRLSPPDYSVSTVINRSSTPSFAPIWPIDMVLDRDENFVVLDRGGVLIGNPPSGTSAPRILTIREDPLEIQVRALNDLPNGDSANVAEPTALTIDHLGRLLVADSRDQLSQVSANIIRIDPATGIRETLLPDNENPLVNPTGMVFEAPNSLLVCDTGMKNGYSSGRDDARYVAENPAIFRIDLSQSTPTVIRISKERKLVTPSDITIDNHGKLIICDSGNAQGNRQRNWRTKPHEFGVNVLFSLQREADGEPEKAQQIRRLMKSAILTVIDEQKPSETYYWMT